MINFMPDKSDIWAGIPSGTPVPPAEVFGLWFQNKSLPMLNNIIYLHFKALPLISSIKIKTKEVRDSILVRTYNTEHTETPVFRKGRSFIFLF